MEREKWPLYVKNCDVILYVVDSSENHTRIEQASTELHNFIKISALKKNPKPLLIVSNKIDREIHYSLEELCRYLKVDKLPNRINWVMKETSATVGTNVMTVLSWLTKYAKEQDAIF
jgi:GTPase Era involved in 16S rRNA processing